MWIGCVANLCVLCSMKSSTAVLSWLSQNRDSNDLQETRGRVIEVPPGEIGESP